MNLDLASTSLLARMALEGVPPINEMNPVAARMALSEIAKLYRPGPEMKKVTEVKIDVADGLSIRGRILQPDEAPRSVLVYFHGGGWVLGNIDEYETLGRQIAQRTRSAVLLVDYRKAPEHQYPTAVEDSWAAVKWADKNLAHIAGKRVPLIVGGDSAGGHLAAIMAQRSKAEQGPEISLQVLVYPVTDAAMDTQSYKDPQNQLMLSADLMKWFLDHYVPNDKDRTHPDMSPLRAPDFSGLPPAIILTAEFDIVRDEGEAYVEKLRSAGVPVVHKRFERQMHGFFAMPGLLPAAAKGLEFIGEQIDRHLSKPSQIDAVIVGAGFAGMYQLYKLRAQGLKVRVIEAADDVGGTWYWNRYPGARCDVESMAYAYSFSSELEQDWQWTERYATQPEILRYASHVADRFDLRPDITFGTKVVRAIFDEDEKKWVVHADNGETISAQYLIMATGCLSIAKKPDIPGADKFLGATYQTGHWPHEDVDFTGLKVAIIGTGSSGIQSIPLIAQQAKKLVVYQRTAAYSAPALNRPLSNLEISEMKQNYPAFHEEERVHAIGLPNPTRQLDSALGASEAERKKRFEKAWDMGLLTAFAFSFGDIASNEEANEMVAQFFRDKIKAIVKDPETAENLLPHAYPYATKRPCLDSNYYETFNLDHVSLVSLRKNPIERITPKGIRAKIGEGTGEEEFDVIVFATGFDAMTGALTNIDIRGIDDVSLKDRWTDGPRTYLGIGISGFPNLFTITGPSSPSVLCNMFVAIEQHVDWIADCIKWLRERDFSSIEPTIEAEDEWAVHTEQVAEMTLYPKADSWYIGANVPGKSRVFMAYVGGFGVYSYVCAQIAASGYTGFKLSPAPSA